jgi:hypothetical protein
MQDLGTYSIDELIGKLVEVRNRIVTENGDPNQYAVYTVGPIGQYRVIQTMVLEEDGLYLNTGIPQ